jgi:hypothetical protein
MVPLLLLLVLLGGSICLMGSGSFHFVYCFAPFFFFFFLWVLWLIYGWQGFIIISHHAGCFFFFKLKFARVSTIEKLHVHYTTVVK